MYFPAAVFVVPGKACEVSLPDVPGCNTAGESLEEALAKLQEALELALEDATSKPVAAGLLAYKDDPAYQGAVWALVSLDLGFMDERCVRVNITVPSGTLEEIDKAAKGRGLSRSAFLVRAARKAMTGG